MKLKLDFCSHEATRYAVKKWHYSKRMPIGRIVKIGCWEDEYIGAVLFARGASPYLGHQYGLDQTELCELVRVALHHHENPVTKIVSVAIRLLRKHSPGLRMIISFADPSHGHVGGIYQGGNWIYSGPSSPEPQYFHDGRWKHQREVSGGAFGGQHKYPDYKNFPKRITPGKYRYLYPLDNDMRKQIEPLKQEYPKHENEPKN